MGVEARVVSSSRCALCGEVRPLTFEHLPPKSTGNEGPGIGYSGDHWIHALGRHTAPLLGDGFADGSGKVALCHDCNGSTAKWYMAEFNRWRDASALTLSALAPAPVRDRQAYLERLVLVIDEADPLAFIKQSIGMILTTCGPDLGDSAPELRQFVLDPQARGLPSGFRLYLTLCSGPLIRWSGVAGRVDLNGPEPRTAVLSELAFDPIALLLSINTDWDCLPIGEITHLSETPRGRRDRVEITVDAGFSHLPYPGDYRSGAMILADGEVSAREGLITPD